MLCQGTINQHESSLSSLPSIVQPNFDAGDRGRCLVGKTNSLTAIQVRKKAKLFVETLCLYKMHKGTNTEEFHDGTRWHTNSQYLVVVGFAANIAACCHHDVDGLKIGNRSTTPSNIYRRKNPWSFGNPIYLMCSVHVYPCRVCSLLPSSGSIRHGDRNDMDTAPCYCIRCQDRGGRSLTLQFSPFRGSKLRVDWEQ
jgi:hypothetical protein